MSMQRGRVTVLRGVSVSSFCWGSCLVLVCWYVVLGYLGWLAGGPLVVL